MSRLIDQRRNQLAAKGVHVSDTEISRQIANNAIFPDTPVDVGMKKLLEKHFKTEP